MFPEERQQKIYKIVTQRRSVKVSDLSNELEISEATIRRDLEELQKQKRIIRTHGGAMSAYFVGKAVTSSELLYKDSELKQQIAQIAYDMIDDHDTLLMDTSSTVHELIKLIASGTKSHLRVITTSLMAIEALSKSRNCNVQLVGGDVNYEHQTCEGSVACRFIRDIRVDKCFIGINGIDESYGFSTPRYADADIKSHMIESSNCSILLADHTKIGKTYLAKITEPDCLITDCREMDFSYEMLGDNVDVIFAEERLPEQEPRQEKI
ncbi:MAG: DeoR/GlpR transcriptional regulator [Clostridiales bacterium]|nr:DeoR/GlpR transcriptional regulator [Clostridiales bacterium]